MLLKHYFQTKDYQKVKIIAKALKNAKRKQEINGDKAINYLNWPEITGNEIVASIYDLVSNNFEKIRY